jgi:hypothetical protein
MEHDERTCVYTGLVYIIVVYYVRIINVIDHLLIALHYDVRRLKDPLGTSPTAALPA